MTDTFKTEYISELMIAGYSFIEAEELYLSELEAINKNSVIFIEDDENDIDY